MLKQNISLARHSSYKIGGLVKHFFEIKTFEDLKNTIQFTREEEKSIFILGGGTNILFPDEGLDDVVIKIGLDYINQDGNILTVGAGTSITQLLNYTITHSLSGLEWAGGLPGTVGGAVRGNAGAFKGEIKDNLREVLSININEPDKLIKRTNQECNFSYRTSIFKQLAKNEIILEATFLMKEGDTLKIKQMIEEKIKYRFERNPMEYPNCGSVFKNVPLEIFPIEHFEIVKSEIKTDPFPVVPTAFLISKCDLKGVVVGGAMISPKHPNFIVNFNNARAEDVKKLINLIKEKVYNKFQVNLEEEILIL